MNPSLSESKALSLSKTSLALRKSSRDEQVFTLMTMQFKLTELSTGRDGRQRAPQVKKQCEQRHRKGIQAA